MRAIAAALDLDASDDDVLNSLVAEARAKVEAAPAAPVDAPVQVNVLGPLEVSRGGVPVSIGRTQRVLLARLALSSPETVDREELANVLQESTSHRDPRRLMPAKISRLRRLIEPLGERLIVAAPSGYRLVTTSDQLDLVRFRLLVDQSRSAEPEIALALLDRAIGLWRGELDVAELGSHPILAAITDECVSAVSRFAKLARDLGQAERALRPLQRMASAMELHEPLHVELIDTLAASGRQAEALECFERIRLGLRESLGIDPSERLREAHLSVLRQRRPDAATSPTMPQQVPAASPGFVGREEQIARVVAALDRDHGSDRTVSRTVVVHGPAGVGKTAWTHVVAHRLRDRYPDGQLYADLRGASSARTSPLVVVNRFLRALGVPSHRIGDDVDESAALLRTQLADRRILIVLDNVADEAQVRPLLPGSGASDAIITGRRALRGLATSVRVTLEPLTTAESLEMIATALPDDRGVANESEEAKELARVCGHLPLALGLATARLATRPAWRMSDLVRRLRDNSQRLAQLRDGTTDIIASFQAGYEDLSSAAQRAFRLCSIHPGEDFDTRTACALTGEDDVTVETLLDELLDASMLLQYAPDRFRYHDLLLLYAQQLVEADGHEDRDDALARLLVVYTSRVTEAMDQAFPATVRLGSSLGAGRPPGAEDEAVAWLDAEVGVLVALAERASRSERHASFAWRIADQLRGYFMARRHAQGWSRVVEAGFHALDRAGDDRARAAMFMCRGQLRGAGGQDAEGLDDTLVALRLAEDSEWDAAAAYLQHNVGWVHYELGDLDAAEGWLRRVLSAPEHDGEALVAAAARNAIGMVMLDRGRWHDAEAHLRAALDASVAAGRERAALTIRGNLACALRRQGATDEATRHLDAALLGFRLRGDVRGELSTLDEMSHLARDGGREETALRLAQRAHELATQVHDVRARAMTLCTLGEALFANGDIVDAQDALTRAATIAHGHSYRFLAARGLLALGTTFAAAGDTLSASEHAGRALGLARERGFGAVEYDALQLVQQVRASVRVITESGQA
ncbi:DNA-binding SARP family transcriptional activator [Nocardioides luteus]|nr:DNA-binding SARP family transcriptional activator [Nocardioides luteus]